MAAGLAIVFARHSRGRQAEDLDARYDALEQGTRKRMARARHLWDRLGLAERNKDSADLAAQLQVEYMGLRDDYQALENVLRDRMAITGEQPGDHGKLQSARDGQRLATQGLAEIGTILTLLDSAPDTGRPMKIPIPAPLNPD